MSNFVFVTPTRGDIRCETTYCVDKCREHYGELIPWERILGGASINLQFDYCMAAFIKGYTEDYMVMLGSDHTFSPKGIEKLLQAAMEGRDVVDSLNVRASGKLCCTTFDEKITVDGSVVEVISTGLGVSVISRKILLQVIDVLHLKEYGASGHITVWPFFQQAYDPDDPAKSYQGADLSFCNRVREAGGKVYVHTGVQPGHMKIKQMKFDKAICE